MRIRTFVNWLASCLLCAFLCDAAPWRNQPGLVTLQLTSNGTVEAKPSAEEVAKLTKQTQAEIKEEQTKQKQQEAERKRQAGKPTAEEKKVAKATAKVEAATKNAGARKSAKAQKVAMKAASMAGDRAEKHLAKLETLVKKGEPNEDTLASMETQGSLLVQALMSPQKTKPPPPVVPNSAVSGRERYQTRDAVKVEKAEAKAAELKEKEARKEARKDEKFKAMLRIEKRNAQTEYSAAKKAAAVAKTKARGMQSRAKDFGQDEVAMAKMDSKIATIKEKLAGRMLKVQKTKLLAAQEDSRAANSISKRKKQAALDLKNKQALYSTKANIMKEELKVAKRMQMKEKAQEVRAKALTADRNKLIEDKQSAAQLQRVADRDKERMMRALRKSRKGNDHEVAKFEKFKDAVKAKVALAKSRKDAVRADHKKLLKQEVAYAKEDEEVAATAVQHAARKVKTDKRRLKDVITAVRHASRESREELKNAKESGSGAPALDSLTQVKEDLKSQAKLEVRLTEDKSAQKTAQHKLRMHKSKVKKAKKKLLHGNQGKTVKQLERSVERAQRIAAEVSKESSTTERIIRTQAKVDVRDKSQQVNELSARVEDLRLKLQNTKASVQKKARRAKRISEEYVVLLKAAGMADGQHVAKASKKAVKRLYTLDKEEKQEADIMQQYDDARTELNTRKTEERDATDLAYKTLKQRVKVKTAELQQKKDGANERQFKKDEDAAHEPRKYVQLAENAVQKGKEELQRAQAMASKAKHDLKSQNDLLKKLTKGGTAQQAAQQAVQKKIRSATEKLHEWNDRVSREEKHLQNAEKMLESRRHLARVAIAVHKHRSGIPSELQDMELARTKKLMSSLDRIRSVQNTTLEESIETDAQKITKLALSPGGQPKVKAIIAKAIKANKAGVGLNQTMDYVSRKLDTQGWNPSLKESDGLTHDEYENRHLAIQQLGVANGEYGQYAAQKLKHLMKQVDADEDPGVPRHGISRARLSAAERADKASLKQAREAVAKTGPLPSAVHDLDSIVNVLHKKRGMSREQFHAAMEAITDRRIALGTPEVDKVERWKAAQRLSKVQNSWERYQNKLKTVTESERKKKDAELAWDSLQAQHSLDQGSRYFDSQFNLGPI